MFLVSLAIADLLVAIFVMPFAIVNDMQVSIYVFIIALPGFYCHSLIYHKKIFIYNLLYSYSVLIKQVSLTDPLQLQN